MESTTEEKLKIKVEEMVAKVYLSDGGWYRVYNHKSQKSYWVHPERHSCTCWSLEDDYYGLGTCKHIEYVREWLGARNDDYFEHQVVFASPDWAHSFSSMVLNNKKRFHSVWVELILDHYMVHYKSYKSRRRDKTGSNHDVPRTEEVIHA